MSKKNRNETTTAAESAPEFCRYREALDAEATAQATLGAAKADPACTRALNMAGGKVGRARLCEAQAAHMRARAAREQAGFDLDRVLHAHELAQGDVDAIAVDPARAAADIRAALEDRRRAEAAAVEATQRAAGRFAEGMAALERLAARRAEVGHPAPARPPFAGAHAPLEQRCQALEGFAAAGPQAQVDSVKIYRLESEATELRAELRRAEIEAEEQAQRAVEFERQQQSRAATERETVAKRSAKVQAEHEAREEEVARLAREHREREQQARAAG